MRSGKLKHSKLIGTLGVETLGGVFTPVIRKGTALPAEATQILSTTADDQTRIEIHLILGEQIMAANNVSLGKFLLDDIPPAPKGKAQIAVRFQVDMNMCLTVTGTVQTTGHTKSLGPIDLFETAPREKEESLPTAPGPQEVLLAYMEALRQNDFQRAASFISDYSLQLAGTNREAIRTQWEKQASEGLRTFDSRIVEGREFSNQTILAHMFQKEQVGANEPQSLEYWIALHREDGQWRVNYDLIVDGFYFTGQPQLTNGLAVRPTRIVRHTNRLILWLEVENRNERGLFWGGEKQRVAAFSFGDRIVEQTGNLHIQPKLSSGHFYVPIAGWYGTYPTTVELPNWRFASASDPQSPDLSEESWAYKFNFNYERTLEKRKSEHVERRSPTLDMPPAPATSKAKMKKRPISVRQVLWLLVSIGVGLLWLDTAFAPTIQSKQMRFLLAALSELCVFCFFFARAVLELAILLLASIWRALGWRILLPLSVCVGLAGIVSVMMSWVSLPVPLLAASVVSIAVGVVGGSLLWTAARDIRNGWWLFVLGVFCVVASTAWTFLNFAIELRWDWIVPDVVIASVLALRVALPGER